MADEEKKIIIDEDWKNQAQKEKEALKEKEQTETEQPQQRRLPDADFSGLVSMLATQAFYALGVLRPEGEQEQEIKPDFEIAKYNIDTLEVLQDKCKGNLTDEEEQLLKATLDQLRMLFVNLSAQG